MDNIIKTNSKKQLYYIKHFRYTRHHSSDHSIIYFSTWYNQSNRLDISVCIKTQSTKTQSDRMHNMQQWGCVEKTLWQFLKLHHKQVLLHILPSMWLTLGFTQWKHDSRVLLVHIRGRLCSCHVCLHCACPPSPFLAGCLWVRYRR